VTTGITNQQSQLNVNNCGKQNKNNVISGKAGMQTISNIIFPNISAQAQYFWILTDLYDYMSQT
jgi:hypothetical protein